MCIKYRARVSARDAPSSVLAVLCLNLSLENGIKDGSKATLWHTLLRRQAVISLSHTTESVFHSKALTTGTLRWYMSTHSTEHTQT